MTYTELYARWTSLNTALGVPGEQSEKHFATWWSLHNQPHRHYHTMQHVGECLHLLDNASRAGHLKKPWRVEVALWMHDAIYQPLSARNEKRSAALAHKWWSKATRCSPQDMQWIVTGIEATANHAHVDEPDMQMLLDIDMAILASEDTRFAEYETQVRLEYRLVPQALYRKGREDFFKRCLAQPRIYHHPSNAAWEQAARTRLAALVNPPAPSETLSP